MEHQRSGVAVPFGPTVGFSFYGRLRGDDGVGCRIVQLGWGRVGSVWHMISQFVGTGVGFKGIEMLLVVVVVLTV